MKRKITWFVKPLDATTSEIMANYSSEKDSAIMSLGMQDDKGICHLVYRVSSYSFIANLYENERKLEPGFKLYYRMYDDEPIKEWIFD